MTTLQKVIKYLAMAFAIFLAISIIGGAFQLVELIGGFGRNDAVIEDMKSYTITSEISNLDIEINAADFTIKQGDALSVESNLKYLTVEESNGTLTIKETKILKGNYRDATLILYIPANTVFERVNMTAGAGRVTIDSLSAEDIDFSFGAGEVSIQSLIATSSADMDGGAGKITISGGALHNLDLDMGVGQFNLTSALAGRNKFDLGVGETNITVLGHKDDYSVDVEKGLGSLMVDGESLSDFGSSGNGRHTLKIHGGIGAIHLDFQAE